METYTFCCASNLQTEVNDSTIYMQTEMEKKLKGVNSKVSAVPCLALIASFKRGRAGFVDTKRLRERIGRHTVKSTQQISTVQCTSKSAYPMLPVYITPHIKKLA